MAMQKGQCLFILFAAVSPGSGHRRGVSYREGFGQGPSPNGLGNQGPLTPFFFLSFFLYILWSHPWHMEVPYECELQLQAYATAGAAPDTLTHCARQGIEHLPP